MARMSSVSTVVPSRNAPEGKKGFLQRTIGRFFPRDRFQVKLLLGTVVGVVVIVILSVGCVVWTYRTQQREQAWADRIEVIRLSTIVENDISALENAYRGRLLSAGGEYLEIWIT
jgi:CHASE3 domain sensor protein